VCTYKKKVGECGAFVVSGHISNPRYRIRPLPEAPLAVLHRYFTVVPRPMPAATLVMHRWHLIVVPRPLPRCASQALDRGARPMPAAPRRNLIMAPRLLSAAPLVVCRRYLAVVPRPLPAAPLVVRRRYVIVVPRP
jgi:hypothetical protein